ncbi:Protein of unknown function [Riemerella columbipharyngis]|uniref:DUF3810 domain-containing protein n=1 Tax=Riemerella columbipharyngis TaxID=1071918 RepID=A0A1G6Y7L6_9FLAO|nr:Protein of unknown function [Riemerella columbipharyngis]
MVFGFELFFKWRKPIQQLFFYWMPFSVGDLGYLVLGLMLAYFLIKIIHKKTRSKFSLRLLIFLNVFYFLYQIVWGMLYFQAPIIEKLSASPLTTNEKKVLTEKYLNLCLKDRLLVKENKNGVFDIEDIKPVQEEIIRQQKILPKFINNKTPSQLVDFKPSFYSFVMNYTGILGYYNPFTAEAQYNPNMPEMQLPFTLAHESAHQIGYAREEEANFIGYLIGKDSENISLRYSTEYFVLKSLLNDLYYDDKDFVDSVFSRYSKGMKRDEAYEKDFYKSHQGIVADFFAEANDLFLKSNRQDGSISYSYFVDLLIRYEQINKKDPKK